MKSAIDETEPESLHQLSKQSAEEKYRKKLREKPRGASHEGLRPVREQRLPGEGGRDQGRRGRKQEHAPAAKGEPDQQPKANQNAGEPHASDALQRHIEIKGGALAEIADMRL